MALCNSDGPRGKLQKPRVDNALENAVPTSHNKRQVWFFIFCCRIQIKGLFRGRPLTRKLLVRNKCSQETTGT